MAWKLKNMTFQMKSFDVLVIVLFICCFTNGMPKVISSADYGDAEDYEVNGSNGVANANDFSVSNNEEIYDPANLQQAVEKEEHIDMMLEYEDQDNRTTSKDNHVTSQENFVESLQNIHVFKSAVPTPTPKNVTLAKEHEGYEFKNHLMITGTPRSLSIPVTTAKTSEKQTTSESDEILDPDASISEYMDDDNYNTSSEQLRKPVIDSSSNTSTEEPHMLDNKTVGKADEFVPIPMKFFQARQQSERELVVQEEPKTINKTDQAISISELGSSSEEEYYDSSKEIEIKETTTLDLPTTKLLTTTTSPNNSKSISQQIPITIAKAAIGSTFHLPWQTTTVPPITTTMTTKIPKIPSFKDLFSTEPRTDAIATDLDSGVATEEPEFVSSQQYSTTQTIPTTTIVTTTMKMLSTTPITTTSYISTTPTSIPTTVPIVTTTRPKQGKQINISPRRKLLPHEQLHNYIEDAYVRTPLAVIVDPSAECLDKTKTLWNEALHTNLNIKMILVSLNATGVPASYNFNNSRQFLSGLNTIKEHDGGDSFVGILHAAELVPYDSAVYISTAVIPRHTELVQDAAITLLKKRIRLYLIWYGAKSLSENETQEGIGGILGEVAVRSGGEILHIVGNQNSQEIEGSTLTLVADALRGSQEVEIPVDTTLASLHVKIDSPMRKAFIETPYGDINLKKMVKFKSVYTTFDNENRRLDAFIPLTKLRKASIFTLKLVPESLDAEYSVFIRGERKSDILLDDVVRRFEEYFMYGSSSYPARYRNNMLPPNKITPYSVEKSKDVTHDNLRFPDNDKPKQNEKPLGISGPKSEVETFSETEIKLATNKMNSTSSLFDADIITVRASNILQHCGTKIEIGTKSQIVVAPGSTSQLFFEITNLRSESAFHDVRVIDERSYLLSLIPKSVFILPDQTATVTLTVIIPTDVPLGTLDRITLTAQGSNGVLATITVILKVNNYNDIKDTTPPILSWDFGSRCDYISPDSPNCADRFWLLDITAQDWQSGILRLQSNPPGLWYRNGYSIGSPEAIKATYMATCCEPKVSITAYDIVGNQRFYNIDVRDFVLNEASIAAIVLGSLLLLLILILIIASIVWCCRRRHTIINMPTYRSHSTRSME